MARGLRASPIGQVLIEESVAGWGEFELEVIRDRNDNVVIICSIENVDPMGVHTGDSVTVAPAQTLSDREYQVLRDASAAVIRAVGVETGGSNVQFALNRETGELVVIEMNPRVSRSSALASKATGYPIAKVATKLAVGYTLDEIPNDITGTTPASFEPTLDYVVIKLPRFAFEKFPGADDSLTTHMKSVGEVMGIGRSFNEAWGKAMRSRELDGTPRTTGSVADAVWDRFDTIQGRLLEGESAEALAARVGRAPLVPRRVGRGGGGRAVGARRRPGVAGRRRVAAAQAAGHRRRPDRDADRPRPARGAADPQGGRRAPGVQGRRQLRRRGGGARALLLLGLRGRGRARPRRAGERDHPRRRPQPDRPGHRVRLLLRAGRPDAAPPGLRRGDGQLQPGDGVDRRRLVRPPVLRAADGRGRARGDRARAAAGGGRPVRRPDAAAAGPAAGGGGRAAAGHAVRGDRHRRGSRAVRRRAPPAGAGGARLGHRRRRRRRRADRRRDRLPGAGAAELRARRPGDAHLLRRGLAAVAAGRAQLAGRPLRRGRDRGRRGRRLRRHADLDRRGHAARRGGRGALRRLGLRDPDPVAGRGAGAPDPGADGGDRRGAGRPRADQRPVRRAGLADLRDRGQPPGVQDGAVRGQGDRRGDGRGGLPRRARSAGRSRGGLARSRQREGGGAAVQPVLRRRPDPGSGDALDRRGDGHRAGLPDGLRQGRAGRRTAVA